MAPPNSLFHQPFDPVGFTPTHSREDSHFQEEYWGQGLRAKFRIDGIRAAAAANQADDVLRRGDPNTSTSSGTGTTTKFADIGYDVDEEAFLRRTAATLKAGGLARSVPDGWPTRLEGPLVWSRGDFDDESEYVYVLTDADKDEIRRALAFFKAQGLHGSNVSPATFPLPVLGTRLSRICDEVYEGRGFAIVRGLDLDAYPVVDDLTAVYLGISSYIGEQRGRQDQRGSMLMHVIRQDGDEGARYSEDKPFHTDTVTDCVCLFAQSLAAEGGCGVLASAWTVYNELAETRPDLIRVLAAADWPFDTYGRSPPFYTRALVYHHEGKLITSFSRRLLAGYPPFASRTPSIPGLTEIQAEALDALHFTAKRHEIKPRMARGDIRFINNMGVLHRRDAFADGGADDARRHLIRVWVHNRDKCWALPPDLRLAWARVFGDDDGRDRCWDVVPPRKDGKILRVAGSCD